MSPGRIRAGQYTVWSTDSNGNYLSNVIGAVSGNNTTLEALETTFNQDLNGDSTIGLPPPTVIQTDGTTSLATTGGNYFLDTTGSNSLGPELKYGGAAVTAGEFGSGWTPIGAVQVAGGDYDVAWKDTAGQYTVWSTDSNGNYLSNVIGASSGNSLALETLENTFQQDLNGDGVIGIYAAPGTTLQISNSLSGPSGSATIGAGATLELAAANSSSVTFNSSTGSLELDQPSTFDGVIFGFTGNGTLSGSDQIDLKGINFNSVHDSYSNGVLTVTDGTQQRSAGSQRILHPGKFQLRQRWQRRNDSVRPAGHRRPGRQPAAGNHAGPRPKRVEPATGPVLTNYCCSISLVGVRRKCKLGSWWFRIDRRSALAVGCADCHSAARLSAGKRAFLQDRRI